MRSVFFVAIIGSLALIATGRKHCPTRLDNYVEVGERCVAKREYDTTRGGVRVQLNGKMVVMQIFFHFSHQGMLAIPASF